MNDPMRAPSIGGGIAAGGGGLAVGAVLSFLLFAQGETVKQDTEIIQLLSALGEQNAQILIRQQEVSEKILNLEQRMLSQEDRLRRQEESVVRGRQEIGASVREDLLRHVSHEISSRLEEKSARIGLVLSSIMDAILAMEAEGEQDVWTSRGPPYADVRILSRRIGRKITAAQRDQAVSILLVTRSMRDNHDSTKN